MCLPMTPQRMAFSFSADAFRTQVWEPTGDYKQYKQNILNQSNIKKQTSNRLIVSESFIQQDILLDHHCSYSYYDSQLIWTERFRDYRKWRGRKEGWNASKVPDPTHTCQICGATRKPRQDVIDVSFLCLMTLPYEAWFSDWVRKQTRSYLISVNIY